MLRTWPFHEADLLVSLLTREQGRVKGVARHAMKSRKRFGGALEPATYVRAHYTERPRQDLVRLDSFEILWSPMTAPVDYLRTAGMQVVVEVLEEALPELAPEDNVFRLSMAALKAMEAAVTAAGAADRSLESRHVRLAVTYFCLWMSRLMGWMPELGHCAVCGLDLRENPVWWSPNGDGVTCGDDRRNGSMRLPPESIGEIVDIFRHSLPDLLAVEPRGPVSAQALQFGVGLLERHLERRIRSAHAFLQG